MLQACSRTLKYDLLEGFKLRFPMYEFVYMFPFAKNSWELVPHDSRLSHTFREEFDPVFSR